MFNAKLFQGALSSVPFWAAVGAYLDATLTPLQMTMLRDSLGGASQSLSSSNWEAFGRWSAASCEKFFSALFGERLFSLRAVLIVLGYASGIALLGVLQEQTAPSSPITLTLRENIGITLDIALPCVAIDLLVLAWSRRILRDVAAGRRSVTPTLGVVVAVSYLGIGVAVFVAQVLGAFVLPLVVPSIGAGWPAPPEGNLLFAAPLIWPYLLPTYGNGSIADVYIFLPAGFSGLIVTFSLGIAVLSSGSPRWIGRPLAVAFDTIAKAPKGVFTFLGGALGYFIHTLAGWLQ